MIDEIPFCDSIVVCADTARQIPIMALLHKLRGALGRVLAQSASSEALAGRPCPFQPPCSFELFHNTQGKIHEGLEIPKPFVLRADRAEETITLTLRLFGEACAWRHSFHDAWIAAARRGIQHERTKTIFDVKQAFQRPGKTRIRSNTKPVTLRFITPLVLRSPRIESLTAGATASPDVVLPLLNRSIMDRLSGLSHWSGRPDPQPIEHFQLELADHKLTTTKIQRGPMQKRTGLTGHLCLTGLTPELAQLLSIAENTHLGADTVVGAGRFSLQ